MKNIILALLMSILTLNVFAQTNYHQIISLSSLQDTTCGGEFSLISVSPPADSSTTSSYNGNFWFNPPFGVPVTYTIHAEGLCGCVFDTTFTETVDSTQQYYFHIFQIEDTGFYGVPWTDCSVGVKEIPATKKVVRIIDETGRDAQPEPNRLLIYIYNDGSKERKVIVKNEQN